MFICCRNLKEITVDVNNTTYHSNGNCLIETASKTLIAGCYTSIIPNDGSVTNINSRVFYECTNLRNITIPEGVTNIDEYTFYKCYGLRNITIPKSVTSIGNNAINYCSNLETAYYTGTEEEWNKITIHSSNYDLNDANIVYNYIPQ